MDEIEAYKIDEPDSKIVGSALIIDINEFENRNGDKRTGSKVDVEKMESLFEYLNFDVEVKRNLKRREIIEAIFTFKQKLGGQGGKLGGNEGQGGKGRRMNGGKDICAVCIMSHGNCQNEFLTHDNKYLNFEDDILKEFSNKNCETMIGKPKLFFFQSCRGDEKDFGVVAQGMSMVTDGPKKMDSATLTDAMVAYASSPGFVALRDTLTGSPFIQTVCSVFREHAKNEEVKKLWLLVTKKMRDMEIELNNDDVKNVPMFEMRGLIKELYLKPLELKPSAGPSKSENNLEAEQESKKCLKTNEIGIKRKTRQTNGSGEEQKKKRKK